MASKIETELTPAQVEELCATLFASPGGKTLAAIQAAAKQFGVSVSLMGASSFRDGKLENYIADLKAKGDRAKQIAQFAKEGLSLSEAASIRLSETIFDRLTSGDGGESLTPEEAEAYSRIIARARAGDDRAKKLEAELERLEREKADWQEAKQKAKDALTGAIVGANKKGLTRESLRRIEEAARLL